MTIKKEMYVNRNGLTWYHKPTTDLPNPDKVKLCEDWLKEFIDKRKTINKDAYSYRLKHVVERYSKSYIANGEFIQASINLGYNIEPEGNLNASFNMSMKRWNKFVRETQDENDKQQNIV